MKTKLVNLAGRLRTSLWFIPSLLVAGSFLLALIIPELDARLLSDGSRFIPGFYHGGADGARAVLAAIAGSMITVTGVTFSITIVSLTLASTQFGPRLLDQFLRDRGNQFVLGIFLATFLYCLLVLRRVNGLENELFVPHLSVTVGIVFAVLSLGVLIYFIHHAAQTIRAENVIALVGADLHRAIERFYPQEIGENAGNQTEAPPGLQTESPATESTAIGSRKSGYIQAIDGEGLLALATKRNLILRLNYKPGRFVMPGGALVNVWPVTPDEDLSQQVNDLFILGSQRTGEQDLEFSIEQLVELAVRALSPGINDPFTAIHCTDQLAASLVKLTHRSMPSRFRYDDQKRLRLIADFDEFDDLTNGAFNQIRQYAAGSAAVTIRLLEVIGEIGLQAVSGAQRATLLRHARMIERGARRNLHEPEDLKDAQARFEKTRGILERAPVQKSD